MKGLSGLLRHQEPLTSPVGIALSVLSLVVMPVLAYAKQRTGKQMGSRALVARFQKRPGCAPTSRWRCSSVSGSYALLGWWWADPIAALVMLPVIIWQGWETLTEAREPDAEID